MGKQCFRIDTSTDFAEIGDDGKPYWIRADESRELVTDAEQVRKLIEAARGYGLIDSLEGTSLRALQNNELTIGGSLFGLGMDEEGDLSLDEGDQEEGNKQRLIERAILASGASRETLETWTPEQLRGLIREARQVEPPPGTSAHKDTWGKRLTIGSLLPKEEPE